MSNTETVTKRSQRPRDVDYTLEVLDGDLPEMDVIRRSPLEDQLDKVLAEPKFHGKWVRIGSYAVNSGGTAAANVLRKRHGKDATIEGWTFKPKRQEDDRTALFVKFDPKAVVDGAKEAWVKEKAAAKAAKASGNGEGDGSDQTPREQNKGPQATSGTASAASSKAPK